MLMQVTDTILMIRPASFGYNSETAVNNFFQSRTSEEQGELQEAALKEFDGMVQALKDNEIEVLVVNDTPEPPKPDAIFPNNWLATSPEGIVSVFPLFAQSRRVEKREDILKMLAEKFIVKDLHDWTEYEPEGKFLEGTGSMVMDYDDKVIYACYSPRTDLSVLEKFANANGYRAIVFLATDKDGNAVYHTNVVMTVGEKFAILCEEAIEEEWELIAIRQLLETTDHEIIPITRKQMHAFAGNMLEVKNKKGENFLVMSQRAFDALTTEQKEKLSVFSKLLPIAVPTIEKVEGGSVRCMMTEIFLEKR
jgi:hypothetical protein